MNSGIQAALAASSGQGTAAQTADDPPDGAEEVDGEEDSVGCPFDDFAEPVGSSSWAEHSLACCCNEQRGCTVSGGSEKPLHNNIMAIAS